MSKNSKVSLELAEIGFRNILNIHRNLSSAALIEEAVKREEGMLSHGGAFITKTGKYTGRSPKDRFVVKEASSKDQLWWGEVNQPISEEKFDSLFLRLLSYWQGRDLFLQDCYVGADKNYRLPLRVITEDAWHSMFARNMFIRITDSNMLENHKPKFTVINAPCFKADPLTDGTNSEAFVLVNFAKGMVIIGGTSYAGEIKKSIFSVLNFILPQKNVMSMHCSANIGKNNDVAVFFGLSGTGKTTLSADPNRKLIGDDEHGWSDKGVFNFEGGCYAKVINLDPKAEPEIHSNTEKFGTILENVVVDGDTRRVDLNDSTLTENTRAAYPITKRHVPNAELTGYGGHPEKIFMLTADAFGVLPPISKLTPAQAMYHFISGYTAKVGGTELGITMPIATFSTCFGAPFLALHPSVYTNLLGEKIEEHNVICWLINTGWTGGPYGVGSRIKIQHTRAMVTAALDGKLANAKFTNDPVFNLLIPNEVPNVPSKLLIPRNTWENVDDYDEKAKTLAALFKENLNNFAECVSEEVTAQNPKL
ncbi:MAG TPA: phosphoenolpyruvate carboxykinase (ATP) [Nitrospinota bacterium]|nr:phosphoenolpyruvate carboxykinase (ATP) [Nitrospinota bacterium]|tara:strand:+ start:19791 stop:21395 length:1605 start_codon:yes stop_codon:yes gene_type:complete